MRLIYGRIVVVVSEVEALQWLTSIQDLCRDNAPTKLIGCECCH